MIKLIIFIMMVMSSEFISAQDGLGESSPACPAPNTDRSVSGFQGVLNVGEGTPKDGTHNSDAVVTDQVEPPSKD